MKKKRHPLRTQILLYGITTCWGTIFENVEIVKKKPKHLLGSLM